MTRSDIVAAIAAAAFGALGASSALAQSSVAQPTQRGPGSVTAAAPDLVPIASRILNGTASVRNAGSANAGAFVLTVQCQRQGGGGCADHRGLVAYQNPAYPGRMVINVPGLAAGHVFNHALPFWNDLAWDAGHNYNFLLEADAGKAVGETNEGNNFGGAVLSK